MEEWNRDELYKEVWEQPLVKLAAKYGISAVALGKVCRKLQVPLPGRGYWARKQFGKPLKQKPLPRFENPPVVRRFKANPEAKPAADPSDPELVAIANAESQTIEIPAQQHRVLERAARLLRRTRTDEYGRTVPPPNEVCPEIRVSKELLERALSLMNALLFALEANGLEGIVRQGATSVEVFGQNIGFGIVEDLRVKERREEKRYYSTKKVVIYERSGNLVFEVNGGPSGSRKRWADGKYRRLEQLLPQCLGGLMRNARGARLEAEKWQKWQDEWDRKQRERAELAQRIHEEEEGIKTLEAWAANWAKAEQIRVFLAAFEKACEAKSVPLTAESPKGQWLAWARRQADRLDPLVDSPPSVLDRKAELSRW